MTEQTREIIRHASTWSIVWGLLLIVLGMFAIALPTATAVAVTIVIAWLVIFAGAIHLAVAFHSHRDASLIWKLLVGLAYLAVGIFLISRPLVGVDSLTLVIACLFLLEGILNINLFFSMRSLAGSGWILVDGIVTLILGLMIYLQWPSSSAWAIGTLVGASMIVSGLTRVMLSMALRKVAAAFA